MKKNKNTLSVIILIILIGSLLTSCGVPFSPAELQSEPSQATAQDQKEDTSSEDLEPFDEFADELFRHFATSDSISLNFLLRNPENYGIEKMAPTYGDYGTEYFKKEEQYIKEQAEKLLKYDYSQLDYEQQLTYDLLENDLVESEDYSKFFYHGDILSPTIGFQANLPFIFSEYHINKKEDFDDYIAILEQTPEFFEKVAAFEKEKKDNGTFMAVKSAEDVIKQIRTFTENPEQNLLLDTFDDKLSDFGELSEEEIADFTNRNKTAVLEYVIPAFNNLATAMEELNADNTRTGGLASITNGKEYYSLLVESNTGSEKSVEEIDQMVSDAFNQNAANSRALYSSDPQAVEQMYDIKYPEDEPRAILEYLRSSMTADFPEIKDDTFNVKNVHESMEEFSSPAFYFTPPIDDPTQNSIYINHASIGSGSQDLFVTLAHEGYPGHLYQIVSFKNLNRHPVRSVLDYSGYTEGWATYVERFAYEYAGLPKDLADIRAGEDIVNLCLYAKVDIGVNYYDWGEEEVAAFLSELGISDKTAAKQIYDSMVAEPANYLKYTVGCLEILELKAYCESVWGNDFDLKEFHRFMVETGPAPFGIIQDRADDWMESLKKRQAA